jgi:cell division protease FtsH
LVNAGETAARELLAANRELLDRMAEALLERETLDAEEIEALVEGNELPDRDRIEIPTYRERAEKQKEKRRAASIFGNPKPVPSA